MNILTAIQTELKCPKSQRNNFGNYNYRSCEDILESVKPLLKVHDVSLNITDRVELIGDRFYIVATASLVSPEGVILAKSDGWAREELTKKGQDASQTTGSTSSYARKYALNGLFGIDDTKDSDFINEHGKGDDAKSQKVDSKKDEPKKDQTKKDDLTIAKEHISNLAKELYQTEKRDLILEVIKKYSVSGNPNAITDISKAKALYSELKAL